LSDAVFASQSGKTDLACLITTDTVRLHEDAGRHLFECQIKIVRNERFVFWKHKRSGIDRRRRRLLGLGFRLRLGLRRWSLHFLRLD
jgi:hypothetical protein